MAEGKEIKYNYTLTPFDMRLRRMLMINSTTFNDSGKVVPDSSAYKSEFGNRSIYEQVPFSAEKLNGTYNIDTVTNSYIKSPETIMTSRGANDDKYKDEFKEAAQNADNILNSMASDSRRFHGTASIMNPYAFTRLYGADGGKFLTDRFNRRKYYEIDGVETGHYAKNPTTSNIIKWGNMDPHARHPYDYQDFAYCKYWNVIENNRLITLRRYAQPTLDNLNFPKMDDNLGITTHPVATALTYFGGDTGNKLSDLLKFSASYGWEETKGEIWKVTSQAPSMEVLNKATGWDKFFNSGIINASTVLGFLDKNQSTPGNPRGNASHDANAEKGLPNDPYEDGQYKNRILGPINKINTVYKRDDSGLHFHMDGLKLTFEYVARPFGNINPKAALLDIMSNLLVMGYSSGVFFGGSHRFFIAPTRYPFHDEKARAALHQGKILGDNGAAQILVRNYRKVISEGLGGEDTQNGTGGAMSIFKNLLDFGMAELGDLAKAVGLKSENGGSWFQDMMYRKGESLSNKSSKNATAQNMYKNFNEQIASTVQGRVGQIPFLTNMRAILTGEPVGDWHLTIGNPMNPIAEIGNLICKDLTITFSDELGPDDFPIGFKAEITLEHGMPRDRDGIEAMFNRGMGRIYELPDKYSSSADGQTEVDRFTGTHTNDGSFTWRSGYQTPARNTYSVKGSMDNKGPYRDAYPEPSSEVSVSFMSPTINLNDMFYKQNTSCGYHMIMPWQTKVVI